MEKIAPKFENFWNSLQISLKVGDVIPHWSSSGKYNETNFWISGIFESKIEIKTLDEKKLLFRKTILKQYLSNGKNIKMGMF